MAHKIKSEMRKPMGKQSWDEVYATSTEPLPWDTGCVDPDLCDFLQSLPQLPRTALEIGCGTGTNAIWMAEQGIQVTATDISSTAIAQAAKKLAGKNLPVSFKSADVLQESPVESNSIDFVFDRGVYHVMLAGQRATFIDRVADALKSGGMWLCLAGSADEVRENPEMGPPQLKASELVDLAEAKFAIVKLERSQFVHPSGYINLAWRVLYTKR